MILKTWLPHIRWLPVTLALSGGLTQMSAQKPSLTVNDYLSEVRVFPGGTPDFAKIASSLGVDASLSTLGAGAQLVAAIRNDSGQAVETRVLFQVAKGGKTVQSDLEVSRSLQAGEAALVAPREVGGTLAMLLHAGKPGLAGLSGPPTVQPLGAYQGATVTVSIDSATLASGKFIGVDTQNMFDELVDENKAGKKFFSDLTGWLSAGQTQTQITQALAERKSQIQPGENMAAITVSGLIDEALNWQERRGMAYLVTWAANQSATWAAKPSIHR